MFITYSQTVQEKNGIYIYESQREKERMGQMQLTLLGKGIYEDFLYVLETFKKLPLQKQFFSKYSLQLFVLLLIKKKKSDKAGKHVLTYIKIIKTQAQKH